MNLRNLLLVLVPSSVYVGHAAMYWHWMIDDAGISIAYAHNLVSGHGLVAQAGAEPVEGFSNPLWTLLLALLMATGAFSLYWTVKVLSCVLAVATFSTMLRFCRLTIRDRDRGDTIFLGSGLLAACCPSFVIWTGSGLENGLLASLAILLLTICAAWAVNFSPRLPALAGAVAGLLALTRPDALVYAIAFPIVAVVASRRAVVKPIAIYLVSLLVVFAPYEAFRIAYFGDFVPNTFHAKPGASLATPFSDFVSGRFLLACMNLFGAAIPPYGWLCATLFSAFPLLYMFLRESEQVLSMLLLYLFLSLAIFAYLALPSDWMGEYRFATVLFPIGAMFFLVLAASVIDAITTQKRTRILAVLAATTVAFSIPTFFLRSDSFANKPTAPLALVTRNAGMTFNWYRKQFGIENASLLSPDLGGALIYSELNVIDLAGLCDKTIGRVLYRDSAALRDYLLEDKRPTFVHLHSVWRQYSGLPTDKRFVNDYVKLSEVDWVRRDAISHLGEERALAIASRIPSFDASKASAFPSPELP